MKEYLKYVAALKKMKRQKKNAPDSKQQAFSRTGLEKRDPLTVITWEWIRNVEHAAPADETAFEFLSDIRPESPF